MLINIATPGNLSSLDTCIRVKAELSTGFLEIYKGHSPMAGKIKIGSLEISFLDKNNQSYEKYYMAQDGVFTVSTNEKEEKCVYIYAQRLLEIDKSLDLKKLEEELQNKQKQLKEEFSKLSDEQFNTNFDNEIETIENPKARFLVKEIRFLDKSISYTSELKKASKLK